MTTNENLTAIANRIAEQIRNGADTTKLATDAGVLLDADGNPAAWDDTPAAIVWLRDGDTVVITDDVEHGDWIEVRV